MDINEERLAFYFQLGLAITQWAHVEIELSGIVHDRFASRQGKAAMVAFRAIENFRSKLQYIGSLLEVSEIPVGRYADWFILADKAQKHAAKRNFLAHRFIFIDLERKAGRRMMLLPMKGSRQSKSQKDRYAGAICLRDVVAYRLEFFALQSEITNFRAKLCSLPEQVPKSQEQPMRPPQIAQILKEIRGFVQYQPAPS